ncbi:MAG: PDZ domain-containing protein [Candidatus Eremiobacteraeota bacterium]|nr:PDZ domain-containing protein [Candidatus Eremiobacteraeota bacterium]
MNQGYYRFPTIASDVIVFVCEDDLWSVPVSGGAASRLTVNFGTCSTPRLSPDGKSIAFISTDEGHPEVYLMPAQGGRPKRLTFLGGTLASMSGWSADGTQIFFVSNAVSWYERATQGYSIPVSGGRPAPLGLGHMKSFSFGPHSAMVIGRNETDPARWKRYRGGTAGELWIDARGDGTFERMPIDGGNPVWPMWIGERIFFLDDRDGIGNIHSCTPAGDDLRRETHEPEYYARFPSTDGSRIVYSSGGAISILHTQTGEVEPVQIDTASAAPQTGRRFLSAEDELEHFAPAADGTGLALIARGQAFTLPFWEEAPVSHGSGNVARSRLSEWMSDGKRFACVTDCNGFEQIVIHHTQPGKEPELLTTGDIGRVTELACSPTNDTIAFANHRHELVFVDGDGKTRIVDKSIGNRVADLAFSPDGRYLAYIWWPSNDHTAIVRIVKVKSGKVHDVTSPLRIDHSPAWDPEGKYLYFISTRDFNPVYDALQFDLSFPQAQRPFVVTLRDDVPSPFVPKVRPLHRDHDHHDHHDRDDDNKKDAPVDISIDFDGIAGRVLGFPIDEGEYDQIAATKGRVYFTKFDVRGIKPAGASWDEPDDTGALLAYDFDQQRCATIAQEVNEFRLAADHRTLIYRSHERLRAIDANSDLPEDGDEQKPAPEAGRKSGWIELDRVSVEIDPRAEWAQMYREAWRLQTEHFWVEDMSDIDWDRVYDRYRAILPRVRTRTELSDLIWEMQGELGTSHAYEFGGDHRTPPQYQRGFLGAELAYDEARNGYRIERIYRGDSWNRQSDSPLAEPGLDVREGDILLAIGGRRLSRTITPDQLLVNQSDREVALTIASRKGGERRVLVKTLASEAPLRYRAWVQTNRRYVHERTGGKIGYIHIPDMGPWGFSEFHRGYLSEFEHDGLIVDVRYNRGGHVSPLLLEKLARKRVGYDISRYGKPVPYPPESVGGAMIALTDQFAGSDGDIFSHCFKLYGLGPLVGKRTWGGVIGINPTHRLVDGTLTTQPEFSFWFKDVGWKVENYGTDPDYLVDIAPDDYRDSRDPQMEKALELITAATADYKPEYPDLGTKPSLSLPSLN